MDIDGIPGSEITCTIFSGLAYGGLSALELSDPGAWGSCDRTFWAPEAGREARELLKESIGL